MKISHEIPLSMLSESRRFNNYDYCLCHLYDELDVYRDFYKASVKKKRHVLLDNSIFELGTAFDSKEYARIIQDLNPTEYIVPDSLENADETIELYEQWRKDHLPKMPSDIKTIGVVQGKTYEDIKRCMEYMIKHNERIAISFDYSLYEEIIPDEDLTKLEKFMYGRCKLLEMLDEEMLLPYNKSYHLLGCSLPQEYIIANKYNYVKHMFYSADTSNPIVHGIHGIKYKDNNQGLDDKLSIKLADLIHHEVTPEQKADIKYNIKAFKDIISNSQYSIALQTQLF